MPSPKGIHLLVDDCLTGENRECRYLDFFSKEEIDYARNSSKYLLHFTPGMGDTIFYPSFSYGRGSTYHWATLTQYLKIIEYSKGKNISHAFIIEGDVILSENDVSRIGEFFASMEEEDLDFIVSMQHNLGHTSGNACFTSIDYWEKVCSGISAEEFLKTTYPSWSAERYVLNRMILSGGRGKILSWEDHGLSNLDFPPDWIVSEFKIPPGIQSPQSVNLFFPKTKKIGLSSSSDRSDQDPTDPLAYVQMGTGKKSGIPVFFIWNTYNGETVKEIKAKITIFNGESIIFNSNYNLSPGVWAWSPIFNLKRNSHCAVEILVVDVNGEEFHFSDRFGSVGDSINMRDVIPE
jgi:hypothetical protein